VASLTASPETVFLNQTVNFSAELSTDEDGSVTLYSFDFGDGNSTGWVPDSRASHAYQRPGTFNASLLVRDDDGFNSSFSPAVKVTVRNRSPVVKATVSQEEGTSSTLFRFSVPSGGAYDPDGTIVSYQWDFGDGTCATASTASHTFRAKGTHEVRFRVTDNWGAFSEVYFNITILNRAPEISAAAPSTPLSITLGWEQEFKVTALDPDNDTLSYNWTLNGAPQASNGSQLLLKPEKKGEYQVGLTVSDGEQSVSREWTLSVKPKPSNREEANAMLLVLPAALILIVIAAAVAAVAVRRSRRKEPEAVYAPPGYQPAAEAGTAQAGAQGQAPAEAPADAIPFAAPVDPAMAGPSRPGYSSPQEAIPYAEPVEPQAGQAAPPEAREAPEHER